MQYQRKKLTGSLDKKGFFGLLLDITPKVSRYSCSEDVDKGYLDCPEVYGLFPPIFRVGSMDAFAKGNKKGWEALRQVSELLESKEDHPKYLYNLGRPLWGASSSDPATSARRKVFNKPIERDKSHDTPEALALLSYRSDFHVTLPSLAETMVTKYLRYIVGVNEDATSLQTIQPSELILAAVSTNLMTSKPEFR